MTKKEKLPDKYYRLVASISIFKNSSQTKEDYLRFIESTAGVYRQGTSIDFLVESAIEEAFSND
jgi:hypothetical protein